MAHIIADRVRETTTTGGTGAFNLGGAMMGARTFASVMATPSDTCDYFVVEGSKWEVGLGTLTASNTLARTQVFASSNSGAAVNFTAGVLKEISLSVASARQQIFRRIARGHLSGCGLSNDGGASTGNIDILEGFAAADAAPYPLMSFTRMVKTTAAWSAGFLSGGLDTGSAAANTWYYFFIIGKADLSTVDAIYSTSPTGPTMPSGYVWKRYIGARKTNSFTEWPLFKQYGDHVQLAAPSNDAVALTVGTTPTSVTVTAPRIEGIRALLRAYVSNSTAATQLSLFPSSETGTTAPGAGATSLAAATAAPAAGQFEIPVNASGQIKAVSTHASTALTLGCHGWIDSRGRFD